jgi:hyperosmotically inducible protein
MIAALALPASGAERSTGESVDDTTLGMTTKYELANNSDVPSRDLNVEVYKGTVQLSGFLQNDMQKKAALETASKVDGTKAVKDAIVISSGHRSVGHYIDDQTIQGKLKLKLANVTDLDTNIAVASHVRNGEVLLAGFVDNSQARDDVVAAAKAVEGVTKVHNEILLR